ncbi:UNVERIFIED_CONTAM: hypothetical protein PYX00_004530 [Menopon gallinae]|uniref:Uncharacterized protein n=1 Tax=Menopon gallinae TaxID=328185 RepID=A0AAW2I526_9NEOP
MSPRRDERKFGQRRTTNEKPKQEARPLENNETSLKTSYAKKLLNGLEQSSNKETKTVNGAKSNGPSDYNNAQTAVMNVTVQSESNSVHSPTKTNYSNKRLSNDKFIPAEGKRSGARITNGNVKNGFDRQRYNRGNVSSTTTAPTAVNKSKEFRYRKPQAKWEEVVEDAPSDEVIAIDSKNYSEKSSSVSELSSPTELSSGQNTPPEKLIVRKMEEKIDNEFNRSFEEKLKQNLNEVEKEAAEEEEEEEEQEQEPEPSTTPKKPRKKGKGKDERKPKVRSKRKKKQAESKESEESPEENPLFQFCGKSQDFLSQAWESMNKERVEPMPDLESILTTDSDELLETLGIVQKWTVPKLPLASDLMLFSGFGRERPKLKFEDFFAPPVLKELQGDMFAKTNISNMRSTKPEEFFATVVDSPRKDTSKNSKSGKKKSAEDGKRKGPGKKEKPREKEESKSDEPPPPPQEELKLGIVEAVNTWLKEQGDPEKVLSVEALKRMEPEEEPDQKNGLGNPIHASSVEEGGACIRVANVSKDDGYLGTETTEKREGTPPRLYRSSSWDAKLSEVQIKKRLRFLTEATSWDRKWLKDSRLLKHFKFIADSANFCHELLGDVRNGYVFAREELCDPKQSVSKYYTLSPSVLDSANEVDCDGEAFDALEYKFREVLPTGNLSITDSGVHSDTESNEEAVSELKHPLPNKQVCCKMQ